MKSQFAMFCYYCYCANDEYIVSCSPVSVSQISISEAGLVANQRPS